MGTDPRRASAWVRRALLALLLWLGLGIGLPGAAAASLDALYIDCQVQSNGSVQVSLAVSARFDSQERSFTIPLTGDDVRGVSVSGGDWELRTDDGWSRVVLHSDAGFIGRQSFVVSYRADNAADPAEYVLPLVGSRWDCDAAEVSFDIRLPTAVETWAEAPVLLSGYNGELMGVLTQTATGLSASLDGGLMAHESLTVELTLPEGYFGQARLRNLLAMDWGLVLLGLLAVLSVAYWARALRSRRPVVRARVLPPEGWTPAEVPMILDGSRPSAAALLPLWGQLGYVYVDCAGGELILGQRMAMGSERPAHEGVFFRSIFEGRRELWLPDRRFRQAEVQAARTVARQWRARLFDRRGGNPRLMRLPAALTAGLALSVSAAAQLPAGAGWTVLAFVALVPGVLLGLAGQQAIGALRRRPWVHREPLPGLMALLILLLVGLARPLYTLPALALQVFTGWQLAYGGRRSADGVEALGQLLSLRQFLLRATPRRLQEMLRRDPAWLQTVLPYAVQLGLAGRLARHIGPHRLEPPAWLHADAPLTTPQPLAQQLTDLMAQLSPAPRSRLTRLLDRLTAQASARLARLPRRRGQ